jgi:hypothetical protein
VGLRSQLHRGATFLTLAGIGQPADCNGGGQMRRAVPSGASHRLRERRYNGEDGGIGW